MRTPTRLGILLILALLILPTLLAQPFFINTRDWREALVLSTYAYEYNHTPILITSLGDAQIKMKSLPPGERVILYESSAHPTVKNFAKTLRVNGFRVEEHAYASLERLQASLPVHDEVILVHPRFSTEALTLFPLAVFDNATLRFEAHPTKAYTRKTVRIIAGPYTARQHRTWQALYPEALVISSYPIDNAYTLSNLTAHILPGDWFLYMHPDAVDIHPFTTTPTPILLSLGYLNREARIILSTNRTKLEIISPLLADTAKALERASRHDLKLIVKYGRTVTKLPGLEGKLLPLDTISTDYPFITLNLTEVLLNPEARTITLRVHNTGTIPARVYTTIDYAGVSHADEHTWIILPNETASIIHPLDTLPADALTHTPGSVTLTIAYDYREPLTKTYTEDGKSILTRTLRIINDTPRSVEVTHVAYQPWKDQVIITLHNPTREDILVDLTIPQLNISSYPVLARALSNTRITIPTPNLLPEDVPGTIDVLIAYGRDAPTLLALSSASIRVEHRARPSLVILILILALIILFAWRKKRRNA